MTTTYVCMTVGGTDAESSANGLLVNIGRRSLHGVSFALTITAWMNSGNRLRAACEVKSIHANERFVR